MDQWKTIEPELGCGYPRALDVLPTGAVWTADGNGEVCVYQDGTWRREETPTSQALNQIHMLVTNEGWAVGSGGTILHREDGLWVNEGLADEQLSHHDHGG